MAAFASRAGQLANPARAATRNLSIASRSTAARPSLRPSITLSPSLTQRVSFRRAYADAAPKPKPGKIRRAFRWVWRLTYLSVGGVIGYTAYVIYQDRNPEEQLPPDPSKKTLVILGEQTTSQAVQKEEPLG